MMKLPALPQIVDSFHDRNPVMYNSPGSISLQIHLHRWVPKELVRRTTFQNRVTSTVAFFCFIRKILNVEQTLFNHFLMKEKKVDTGKDHPSSSYEESLSKMRNRLQIYLETLQKFKN